MRRPQPLSQLPLIDETTCPDPLTVLSYGAGQESTAILYRLVLDPAFRDRYAPGRLLVVQADTGDEHKETLDHVRYTHRFCRAHGIAFVHVTGDKGFHRGHWAGGLRAQYRATNTVGSKAFPKSCTDALKVAPIYRFLEEFLVREYGIVSDGRKGGFYEYARRFGRLRMLLGIAKGEERRVAKVGGAGDRSPAWMRACVERIYPLIAEGMDRADCQAYCRHVGLPLPPPSCCVLCPFQSQIEILWLARRLPEDFKEWVEIEAHKLAAWQHKGARNLGVNGRKTLPQVLADAERRYGHMSDAELDEYRFSHGHCTASVY